MNSSYEVDLAQEQRLPCDVTGNPSPSVNWYKNAVNMQSGSGHTISPNGSLTLYDVKLSDSAVYQCIAENELGSRQDQTLLKLISMCPHVFSWYTIAHDFCFICPPLTSAWYICHMCLPLMSASYICLMCLLLVH